MNLRNPGDIYAHQILKAWCRIHIRRYYLLKDLCKSREEGMEYTGSFTNRGHLLFSLEFCSNRLKDARQNPHERGALTFNRGENQEVSIMDESVFQT